MGAPSTRLRHSVALAVLIIAAPSCRPAIDDDWPQWRGTGSFGVSDTATLPSEWSVASDNIRWRTELPGVGNSSPIVAGDRIYLTTAYRTTAASAGEPDEESEPDEDDASLGDPNATERLESERTRAVLGLDRATGALLWNRPLFSAPTEEKHRANTFAAPTPVSDGHGVFAYFGSTLARLDREGEVLWQHAIDPAYSESTRYGAASSLVLTDDSVIVLQDKEYAQTEDVGWLAAYDRDTGERRWRIEWEHTCCTYTTPLVVDRGAGEELIVAHSGAVVSYAASDGTQLWSHEVEILQMVGTPILDGDLLHVSGGAHNVKATITLRLNGAGAETAVDEVWESRQFAPQNASPVLYRGQLYTVTDQGIVASYDAASGDLLWKHRLAQSRNRASLVAGDGKIYVTSTGGTVSVLSAGASFALLAENTLDEPGTNASPAIADGCLLIRTRHHLTCVEADGTADADG